MRRRLDTSTALAIAERQDGVLTRGQVLSAGLTDDVLHRLVAGGAWQRLATGIYVVGPTQPGWEQQARGALLWAGDRAALGGMAAAHRHRLSDEPPEDIDVWIPGDAAHRSNRPGWRLHRDGERRLERARGHLTVTCVEDTVLDVADDGDVDRALSVLTRALATRRTHETRIRAALVARCRVRHRAVLADVVAERKGYESPLEYHADIDMLKPHGLPRGIAQVVTRAGRVDRLLEEYALVLELDGRTGHEGEGRVRDMRRDNVNTLQGLRTLRLGWSDVRVRPCETARTVAELLRLLGWTGEMRRCPRCPPT